MRRLFVVCVLALVLRPLGAGPQASQPLSLTVSPARTFAPASLWVSIAIEPNAGNRALEIVADSPDYYRSSLLTLDGERAARRMTMNLRSLPGGDYEIRGTLFDGAGHQRATTSTVAVVVAAGRDG